jgi:hypothetical protein
VLASKVVNPFTRALEPPFIGRRKDFYIPRLPSNLENIPDVNMYMNVFYIPRFAGLISHIYKPATSSHLEPRLFRQRLWLGLPLTFEPSFAKIINHQDLRTWASGSTIEERFLILSEAHSFMVSRIRPIPVVLKQKNRLAIRCQFGDYFAQR